MFGEEEVSATGAIVDDRHVAVVVDPVFVAVQSVAVGVSVILEPKDLVMIGVGRLTSRL